MGTERLITVCLQYLEEEGVAKLGEFEVQVLTGAATAVDVLAACTYLRMCSAGPRLAAELLHSHPGQHSYA
jgi:hypothetical protein